jgi:O-antigen/teichoic acid export membrane protein
VTADPATPPVPAATPAGGRRGASLTRSATLTAVASLLDYGAKLVVGLVITPLLVNGLGRSLFGVWTMLQQLVVYMNATDGRPTEALRLVISSKQADDDVSRKRRYVGAALLVWLMFLPVIAGVGAVLVWLAPTITKVPPELVMPVRLTCVLLVLSFVAATLASVPESVLRGMNLGYKRMGWQAGLNVIGGGLMAAAIVLGLGLAGLGAAQVVTATVTGLCFWILVKKYVPTFGVARPTKPEVKSLLTMSAWLTGGTIVTHLLLHSDAMILGIVTSPAAVTTYALTRYAVRTATGMLDFTVGAAIPGLGGVIGERQFERAAQIRTELMALTWLFVTAVGATILLWNRSFLTLWVGGHFYAGAWANLLIVCITLQTAFIRSDSYILDAALQPRSRVIVTAIAAALTIPASFMLTRAWGLVGLCLAIFLGRLVQTIAYPLLVARCLERAQSFPWSRIARPAAVTALLFAIATFLGERLLAQHWIPWAGGVVLTFGLTLGVALFVGLPAPVRRAVLTRYRAMGRTFLSR